MEAGHGKKQDVKQHGIPVLPAIKVAHPPDVGLEQFYTRVDKYPQQEEAGLFILLLGLVRQIKQHSGREHSKSDHEIAVGVPQYRVIIAPQGEIHG